MLETSVNKKRTKINILESASSSEEPKVAEDDSDDEFDFLFSNLDDEAEASKDPLEIAREKMRAARALLSPPEIDLLYRLEQTTKDKWIRNKEEVASLQKSPIAQNLHKKGFLLTKGMPPKEFKVSTVEEWAKTRGISTEHSTGPKETPFKYNADHSPNDKYRPLEHKLSLDTAIPLVDTKIKYTNFINDYFTNRKVFYRVAPETAIYRASSNAFVNNQSPKDASTNGNMQLAEILKAAIEVFRKTPFVIKTNGGVFKPITTKILNDGIRYSVYKAWRQYYVIASIIGNADKGSFALGKQARDAIFVTAKKKLKDFRGNKERSDLGDLLDNFKDSLKDLNLNTSILEGKSEIKFPSSGPPVKQRQASSKSDEEFINSNAIDLIYKAIVFSIINYYTLNTSAEESVSGICTYIYDSLYANLELGGSNRSSAKFEPKLSGPSEDESGVDFAANYDDSNPDVETMSVDAHMDSVMGGSDKSTDGLDDTQFTPPEEGFNDDEISKDLLDSLTSTYNWFADNSQQRVNSNHIESLADSKISGNALLSIFYQIMNKVQKSSSDTKYKFPIKESGSTKYVTIHELLVLFIEYLKAQNKYKGEFPEELLIPAITFGKQQKGRSVTEVLLEMDPLKIETNILNAHGQNGLDADLSLLPAFLLSIAEPTALNKNVGIDIIQVNKEIIKEAVDLNLPAYKNAKNRLDAFNQIDLPGLSLLTQDPTIKQKILELYSQELQEIVTISKEVHALPTREKTERFRQILNKYFSEESFVQLWNVRVGITKKVIPVEEQEAKILSVFPQALGYLLLSPIPSKKSDNLVQAQSLTKLADALSQETQEATEDETQQALSDKQVKVEEGTTNLALKNFALLVSNFTKFLPGYTTRLVKALNYTYYKVLIEQDPEMAASELFHALYRKDGSIYEAVIWPQEYIKMDNSYATNTFNALEEVFRLSEEWDAARDSDLDDTQGEKYFGSKENYEDFLTNKKAVLPIALPNKEAEKNQEPSKPKVPGQLDKNEELKEKPKEEAPWPPPIEKGYAIGVQGAKAPYSHWPKRNNIKIQESIQWMKDHFPK